MTNKQWIKFFIGFLVFFLILLAIGTLIEMVQMCMGDFETSPSMMATAIIVWILIVGVRNELLHYKPRDKDKSKGKQQ